MNAEAGQGGDPVADALLALSLFLSAPDVLGGLSLRGAGPARDALFELLCNTGVAVRRLPAHVDDERLLGGVDLAASLATGRSVRARGLLEEIAGGVLVVPERPGYGTRILTGTYREVIEKLSYDAIVVEGSFEIHRVVGGIDELNAGIPSP